MVVELRSTLSKHLSDGDNWEDTDSPLARDLVQGMLPMIGLFAYVVRPHGRPSGPRQHARGDLGSALPHCASQIVLGALEQLFGTDTRD